LKIFKSINDFTNRTSTVATVGTFDGLHAGHQTILERIKNRAKEISGRSVLISFDPHPRRLVHPEYPLQLLTTIDERSELLSKMGLDYLIVQNFNEDFAKIESIDFVRNFLIEKIGVKHLVIGHDHRFGKNREGSFKNLEEYAPVYGFGLEEISAVQIEENNISSTQIRKAITSGNVKVASYALTRPHFISGKVIQGKKIGRDLGFPTANVGEVHPDKIFPSEGVYSVVVDILDDPKLRQIMGIANYGKRPSIGNEKPLLEVHLLEGGQDLYDRPIRVHFIDRIRDEKKFNSKDDLRSQIIKDVEIAKSQLLELD
jgi:riboflavin kinase/FMN adenylyltransferase